MQLTGKQISESNIITNLRSEGIQQQGVDVRIKNVSKVVMDYGCGYVPAKGKTVAPKSIIEPIIEPSTIQTEYDTCEWMLQPGYYEVEFEEGCKIPNNIAMYFKTRSSLVRCGAEIISGQFDAGFETENMGAYLKVNLPIIIEKGARVAQAILTETYEVGTDQLYNGQWQGDKQRI